MTDWRKILREYIIDVEHAEGTHFLGYDDPGGRIGGFVGLTEEERAALGSLRDEINARDGGS